MEYGLTELLGIAVALLALAGGIWKAVSRHNGLVAKIDAASAAAKHQHEEQAAQLRSIQSELKEFKESTSKNFARIYERLDDLNTRVSRLEGPK